MSYRDSFIQLSRECKDVKIVAVSKTKPLDAVVSAYNAGFRIFGENHVQEIVEKYSSWHPQDVEIHMIGHLQSNKVNKVVPLVDMIQSIDSLKLLNKVNSCAEKNGKTVTVLLEVNTSEEPSKTGYYSEEDIFDTLRAARTMRNIVIKGFMTVGPVNHSFASQSFAKLRELSVKCQKVFPDFNLSELSMGMSQDYHVALQEGSTMVRIGTMIFGERNYV